MNNSNSMNPDRVIKDIHEYCISTNTNEAELYAKCVEIYQETYGFNLECEKEEYCEEHGIGFMGLVEFCNVKGWVDNFSTVFDGYIKSLRGEANEVYTS